MLFLQRRTGLTSQSKECALRSLLDRGMAIHEVEVPGNTTPDLKLVINCSLRAASRSDECTVSENVRSVESVAKYVVQDFGHAVLRDVAPSEQLRGKCPEGRRSDHYEKKEPRILFEKKYVPISELGDEEFWEAPVRCEFDSIY